MLCQFLLYRVIFKVLKVLCGLSIHLPQPWQPLISLFLKLLFIFIYYFPNTFFSYCTAWWPNYTYMHTFFFSHIIMLHLFIVAKVLWPLILVQELDSHSYRPSVDFLSLKLPYINSISALYTWNVSFFPPLIYSDTLRMSSKNRN